MDRSSVVLSTKTTRSSYDGEPPPFLLTKSVVVNPTFLGSPEVPLKFTMSSTDVSPQRRDRNKL